jgi:signal transduction histidine kinase
MSLVSIPFAAACVMIIIALMAAVQRKPKTPMGWSIVVTVIQAACVPAAELVMAGVQNQLVHSAAAVVMLCSLLFPALVWMNAPASASEPGSAKYASAAVAMILACGAIIMALDPFLSTRFIASRPQYILFRTEAYTVISALMCVFFMVYAMMMMRRVHRSRSRAERRGLRVLGFYPLAYSALIIAAAYVLSDPFMYALCIGIVSVLAALALISLAADRPLLLNPSAIPAGVMYGIASALLFSFAFAAIDAAGSALSAIFGITAIAGKATLVVGLGLLLWPAVMNIQKFLDRMFHRDIEKVRSLFFEFTERARQMTSVEEIAEAFCSYLEDAFNVSRSELFLLDDPGLAYRCVQMHERSFRSEGSLPTLCAASTAPRAVAECVGLCKEDEQRILREYEQGTVVPIYFGSRIKGFLFVGPQLTGTIFRHRAALQDMFTPAAHALSFIVDRQNLIEQLRRDEARFAQEDRLAMLGTFGAGIAHELRNPLNVISTSAQTILRKPADIDMHAEVARFIADESYRMSRTIDEFLRFSKSNVPEWKNDDIRNIIDNALRSLQQKIEARQIFVCVNIAPGIARIVTSVRHLEHALGNIMQNAVESMDTGGSLTVTVDEESPDRLAVQIRDTGRGIPPELLEKIFDPFFTTKKEGTGLGLPIVRMILNNIGASVQAASDGHGAVFTISLPIDGRIRYD